MKPDDGEDKCTSEIDPDEREKREALNIIIKRFYVRRRSIYSSSVQNYVVGFGDEYQPSWFCMN